MQGPSLNGGIPRLVSGGLYTAVTSSTRKCMEVDARAPLWWSMETGEIDIHMSATSIYLHSE